MKIFFGILAVVLFLLLYVEKDDCKRKHLTWGFMTTIIATAILDIIGMLF